MTGCDACKPPNPGFIHVLKGNREVWGPCVCNAGHIDRPRTTCSLCQKRAEEEKST